VYTNSWCNLAATGARDGRDGFFRERDTVLVQPCKVEATWDGLQKGAYYCVDEQAMQRNVAEAPLSRRAWVVQERLLASRVLHFAADQLYWECLEYDASEAFPLKMPKCVKGRFKDLSPASGGEKDRTKLGFPSDPLLNAYAVWNRIIDTYTAGRLTKEEDKLIAISGLAATMQSMLGGRDEYLAGLWRQHLASQLLWEGSYFGGDSPERPKEYRAPSWSWASIEGHIHCTLIYQADQNDIVVSILDAKIIPSGNDKTGQIKGGYLRLRGRLLPAVVCAGSREPKMLVNGTEVDWFYSWDIRDSAEEKQLYCLPLRKSPYGGGSYEGLLLERTMQADGQYRRWGIFSAFRFGGGVFDEGTKLEESEFEEFDGVDQYTITIV
jgi:hypothetical protein